MNHASGVVATGAAVVSTAVQAALGVGLVAALLNTVWARLGAWGIEPTRRPVAVLAAALVTYAVGGLAFTLPAGLLGRRRAGSGRAFGAMVGAAAAAWAAVFVVEALLDAVESRAALFFGSALAGLVGAAVLGWIFARWLPGDPPRWWRWIVYPAVGGILVWALVPSAPARGTPGQAEPTRPNVVLLVLDTLRADHLSSYGHPGGITPVLDALAREGVRFETAVSASSWTLPSIASIFTGLLPSFHGAGAAQLNLHPGIPTLASSLRAHGYATAGFVGGPWAKGEFGFDSGFDLYDDELEPVWGKLLPLRLVNRAAWFLGERQLIPGAAGRAGLHYKRRAAAINRAVFAWLDRRPRRPFFLFINYFDPHTPYDPPAGYQPSTRGRVNGYVDWWKARYYGGEIRLGPEDVEHLRALYAGEIRYLDGQIGRLLDKLRELGDLDRTILVVTADHGEAFLEHQHLTHGESLYEEEVRVPLLIRFPPAVPRDVAVSFPVQSFDILPTVLELVGVPVPVGVQGRSLSGLARGDGGPADRAIISQLYRDRSWDAPHFGPHILAIRREPWKYVTASDGKEELYRLDTDPGERSDLSGLMPDTASRLAAELRAAVGEPAASRAAAPTISPRVSP